MEQELAASAHPKLPVLQNLPSKLNLPKSKPVKKPYSEGITALNLTEALLTKRNEIFSLERLIDGNLSLDSTNPILVQEDGTLSIPTVQRNYNDTTQSMSQDIIHPS